MHQDRPKRADMSDARQSPRKELIAVRRRVPEGLGVPGAPRGPYLEVREDITEKLEPVSVIVTAILILTSIGTIYCDFMENDHNRLTKSSQN